METEKKRRKLYEYGAISISYHKNNKELAEYFVYADELYSIDTNGELWVKISKRRDDYTFICIEPLNVTH